LVVQLDFGGSVARWNDSIEPFSCRGIPKTGAEGADLFGRKTELRPIGTPVYRVEVQGRIEPNG
jgi:hypothetical protein